ncbi:hypothetical protein ANO14919_042040 [Xylariales sp. No.14919]|nr:hypothetical protein ANO14919_042040 [Xylariales sp. No.14919]
MQDITIIEGASEESRMTKLTDRADLLLAAWFAANKEGV